MQVIDSIRVFSLYFLEEKGDNCLMMNEKKYTINSDGRVVALRDFANVKAGDVGGFVESEINLSHDGFCWVSGDAEVSGNAWVSGDARVSGDAWVFGNARVSG